MLNMSVCVLPLLASEGAAEEELNYTAMPDANVPPPRSGVGDASSPLPFFVPVR